MIQGTGTGSEVHGRGDGDGGADGRMRRGLPGVFQGDIAAETEADQGYFRISQGRVVNDEPQIAGLPAVIGPEQAVGDAAATAVVPDKHVPSGISQGGGHAPDVGGVQASFQSMGQNGERAGCP